MTIRRQFAEIMYVSDVADMLGRNETAFRAALRRCSESVPYREAFFMGRRLAWMRSDIDAWLSRARGRRSKVTD